MLSRTSSEEGAVGTPPEVTLPSALDGFRADAWYLPDAARLGFVEVSAGPFTMGSDPAADPLALDVEGWGEGRMQGTVDVPTFYLARTETTVAQYAAFIRATGHSLPDARTLRGPLDHPVAFVSWPDAVAYARWLDRAIRVRPEAAPQVAALLDDGWRVSLPDEAQWEKAARGDDARIYPWGSEPRPDRANFRTRGTTPVGSLPCPECPHPILDLSGNVWEWTLSPYRRYPFRPFPDAADLDSNAMDLNPDAMDRNPNEMDLDADALFVMRGGSFADPAQMIRAANRGGADPGARRPFIGFRVALVRP